MTRIFSLKLLRRAGAERRVVDGDLCRSIYRIGRRRFLAVRLWHRLKGSDELRALCLGERAGMAFPIHPDMLRHACGYATRFCRQSRSSAASSFPMMSRASEPPIKERRSKVSMFGESSHG